MPKQCLTEKTMTLNDQVFAVLLRPSPLTMVELLQPVFSRVDEKTYLRMPYEYTTSAIVQDAVFTCQSSQTRESFRRYIRTQISFFITFIATLHAATSHRADTGRIIRLIFCACVDCDPVYFPSLSTVIRK